MKDMQKMNMTKGVLLGISVGAAALIAAACSDDPKTNTVVPQPTGMPTGVPTVSPTGMPTGPATGMPTGPGTTSAPTTTSSATTTTAPVIEMSQCTTTTYADGNIGNENTNFSGTRSIYVYGDDKTTACTDDATTPGTLCVEGNATDSKGATDDYEFWGAGVGLQLAETDMTGTVIAPFNAAALGIKKLRFTVSNLSASRPLRVQISRVNDPAIAEAENNYEANGFLYGGSSPKPAKDGVNELDLTAFKLPSWALMKIETALGAPLPDGGDVLDPAGLDQLHSLQFQIASNPGDDTEKYSFCLSNIEWLDANGMVVEVPVTSSPMGDGGVDTMPAPTGSEPADTSAPVDTSAPMESTGDTGAALDYATQIQPILTMKCGTAACHGMTPAPDGVSLPGAMEPNAMLAGRIQTVIAPGAPKPMPPAGSPALTDEEKALLNEWADSK